ncbi:MAG: hypothetical protein Q8W45_08855 [Candidatus Palauibacterales bacterium]|nr:hypothetical protein [Candidatus Palauibacterales bacterium]
MRGSRLFGALLAAVWLTVAILAVRQGADYYRTPIADRAFAPQHELLKPSGLVGHGYGIAGTLMMLVGVALYSARKRISALKGAGGLGNWLQFHIFLCTLGPFLVLLHTTFKFGGIVSIAFWSMTVVVASGVFGRYLFARIPKAMDGRFRDLREVEQEIERLENAIRAAAAVPERELTMVLAGPAVRAPRGTLDALWIAFRGDLATRLHLLRSRRALHSAGVVPSIRGGIMSLVRTRLALEQQSRLLLPFQRLFSYWHLLHLPLAIVLLIVTIVHVTVAFMFGYSWIF